MVGPPGSPGNGGEPNVSLVRQSSLLAA